jgi:hypothetical protein
VRGKGGLVKHVPLLALVAAALLASACAQAASAAESCRDKIYREWGSTGRISIRYPIPCYHDALRHIPSDARVYSDLGTDIRTALQAALGPGADRARETKAVAKTKTRPPRLGVDGVASTSGSSGLPLPILVLLVGGVAVALAAGIGLGYRAVKRRPAS